MSPRAWFFGSALAMAAVLVWMWITRPAGDMPVHFGPGGDPDRWVSPLRAVTEAGVVAGGLFLLMWGMAVLVPRTPWSMFNVPNKEAWEPYEPWVRRRLRDDLYVCGAWVLLLIAGLEVALWSTRDDPEPGMGWGGAWLAVMLVVFVVGLFLRMRVYLTPPDQQPPGTFDE